MGFLVCVGAFPFFSGRQPWTGLGVDCPLVGTWPTPAALQSYYEAFFVAFVDRNYDPVTKDVSIWQRVRALIPATTADNMTKWNSWAGKAKHACKKIKMNEVSRIS